MKAIAANLILMILVLVPKVQAETIDLSNALAEIATVWGVKPPRKIAPAPAEFYVELFKSLSIEEQFVFKQDEEFYQTFSYYSESYSPAQLQRMLNRLHSVPIRGESNWFSSLSNIDQTLKKLMNILVKMNLSEIDPKELRAQAQQSWENRKAAEHIGEVYLACSQEGIGANVEPLCDPVIISERAQRSINSEFEYNIRPSNDFQLTDEKLELRELNSLKRATKIFEDNTYLKDDVGGILGNFVKTMKNGSRLSRCGNETDTYINFVRSLKQQGLLKHIGLNRDYQDVIRNGDAFIKHQAVLLVGLHTDTQYVLDSWLEGGGKMAHILLRKDWEKENDDRDVVPGTANWQPTLGVR
jgi:hypothetical protein